jgi:antirestriction protein ArdC
MNNNVYQMVADKIVEQLNKGIIPWQRPWNGVTTAEGGAINYCSRKPYSLLNQMLLMKGGEWLSFKQIQDLGGRIKKGEKGSFVVFYKQLTIKDGKTESEAEDVNELKTIPLLRYYNVWHISQTEGIESKLPAQEEEPQPEYLDEQERIIEAYVQRSGLKFHNDKPSNRAYYAPLTDEVVVPKLTQYKERAEYYSTTFHELTHSTGAQNRLNRKGITSAEAAFGSELYSREELVAEMGAAMLCNVTGIDCAKAFKNSVAYIQSWATHIKNDPKMFVIAAGQAEKAAKYIQGVEC